MNFRRGLGDEEPEVNLIPLIDVLLVILIFLAASTSFTRFNQIRLDLPQAKADAVDLQSVDIAVSRDGGYALSGQPLPVQSVDELAAALRIAMRDHPDRVLLINADARSTHESVVKVMEAARLAGIGRVNFATQSPP